MSATTMAFPYFDIIVNPRHRKSETLVVKKTSESTRSMFQSGFFSPSFHKTALVKCRVSDLDEVILIPRAGMFDPAERLWKMTAIYTPCTTYYGTILPLCIPLMYINVLGIHIPHIPTMYTTILCGMYVTSYYHVIAALLQFPEPPSLPP
ncbi:hypothetical protein F5Y02DRAFT_379405 [Annulohypoxylon stygium]|nr:hypothetical protein F5Y02DRAFT_379405 [Annulohypoxylon stygium]